MRTIFKVLFSVMVCCFMSCSTNTNKTAVKKVDVFDECERISNQNPSLTDVEIIRIVVCDPAEKAGAEYAKRVGASGLGGVKDEAEKQFKDRFRMPQDEDPVYLQAYNKFMSYYVDYFESGFEKEVN